jgi:hypothetical protein
MIASFQDFISDFQSVIGRMEDRIRLLELSDVRTKEKLARLETSIEHAQKTTTGGGVTAEHLQGMAIALVDVMVKERLGKEIRRMEILSERAEARVRVLLLPLTVCFASSFPH